MRTGVKYCFVLLLFSCLSAEGQERLKFIHIETGFDFIASDQIEMDYIRTALSYAYVGDHSVLGDNGPVYLDMTNQLYKAYLGIKVEVRSLDNYVGLISGLRLTQVVSTFKRIGSPDFFYLRLRQTEASTEYLKVERLEQVSNYLGIPVEVRIFAYRQRRFRLYFSAGTEVGYQLSTENITTFDNPSMNIYQHEVSQIVGEPSKLFATFYGRAGIMLGREKPRLSLGLNAPIFITDKSSTLSKPATGLGLNIQVQFPF